MRGESQVNGPALARIIERDDPTFPRINAGSWTFDGKGGVVAFAIQNHGGQVIRVDRTEGTYAVDASRCLVTVTFATATWEFLLDEDGEGDGIRTDGAEGDVTVATRHIRRR